MTAANVDLTIEQGATWVYQLTLKTTAGAAYDVTGYTIRMHIREDIRDTTPLETLTTTDGEISISTNVVTLSLSATATAALSFHEAVYDIEMQSGAGVVTRIMEGRVILDKEVTR
jgi:hypothetical protein